MQGWRQHGDNWWFTDFTQLPDRGSLHKRMTPGKWQTAPYRAGELAGTAVMANPLSSAPVLRLKPPRAGTYAVHIGMIHNYCDRVLLKKTGDVAFEPLSHSACAAGSHTIEACWWRDVKFDEGDELLLSQDSAMSMRCGIAFIRLSPPGPTFEPGIPVIATADGFPGNHGNCALDDMLIESLIYKGTHVKQICQGCDINGYANYNTKLPDHRYPVERAKSEVLINSAHYQWAWQQLEKYESANRCELAESIEAAHHAGRKLYAYHRMAITRMTAPWRGLFEHEMYEQRPDLRCADHDGTPIARLSFAYPQVRKYVLDHLRETIEMGADGLCLVFNRGWPLVLCEQPIADAYRKRTGNDIAKASPDDPQLHAVRADVLTRFVREIRQTAEDAAGGRPIEIIAMTLASPDICMEFGLDCRAWAQQGLVDVIAPYPYGREAVPYQTDPAKWLPVVRDTHARLCPVVNRMTYEPAGVVDTPQVLLERAETWLDLGVDGLSFWDLHGLMRNPAYRPLPFAIGSADGRAWLREQFDQPAETYELNMFDDLTVDRYHPGWNV